MWKYILFDLDGTLTDSREGIIKSVKYALESKGISVPDEKELLRFIGPPLVDGFQEITGLSKEEAVWATGKYRERYRDIGLFENQIYDGMDRVLSMLKGKGKILSLATSKPEEYSIRILDHFHLDKYFQENTGSTLDGKRNQKADVIREALRRLGIGEDQKQDVLMVGDRKHDILGAKQCGIASLGVYFGFAERGELEAAGADYIVNSVEELEHFFRERIRMEDNGKISLEEMFYERIDFTETEQKIKELIQAQKKASGAQEQWEIHQEYYRISSHVQTMAALAMFRHAINTVDQYYDEENTYYDEMMPLLENLYIQYQKVLYDSPFRKELEQKIGLVAFKNMELQQKSSNESVIPLQQQENALVSEYEKLLASASFDWDGKTLSMPELGKYQTDPDRSVRIRAWNMLASFMEKNSGNWDRIYQKLVENRTAQARQLGYRDYVELGYYRMQRNCYDRRMVENFREQVKTCLVPLAAKIQKKRAERLGIEQLHLYDNGIWFPNGNPVPVGTPQEILQSGLVMYQELSQETAEFMTEMMDRNMFDVLGRENKRQGGFMEMLAEPEMPVVFANFNGTSGDVDVITHECGHAFQFYLAAADPIREHWDITMETAETHSMSMEFFTNPWMDRFFGSRAKEFCRMQLEDAICFIPYGCMVDEFQHIVYEQPDLTPEKRHEIWKGLESEYRPYLKLSGVPFFERGTWWQKQHHIYSFPFYYIDYCIAQICALQYRIWMEKDYKKAWESYLGLCRKSASGFFTDMIQEAGLNSPFEAGSICELAEQLELLIDGQFGTAKANVPEGENKIYDREE